MRINASSLVSINPELIELLRHLEVGDTLKGRVLEALGSSIVVKTASGQVFTALLQEGANISKGAFIEMIVSSIADGKVYAELKEENRASVLEGKILDFLRQVNLPVNKENVEVSKLLIKYGLPLDKEAILNITGLQKSIDNLSQSSEGRIGLLLSGLNIKDTAVDVLNRIVLSWSGDLINPEAENVFLEKADNESEIFVLEEDGRERSEPEKAAVNKPIVKTDNNDGNNKNSKENVNMDKPFGTEIIKEAAVHKGSLTEEGIQKEVNHETASLVVNEGVELLRVLDGLGIGTTDEIKRFAGQITDILASIRNTDMEVLTYLVSKEMKITPKNLGMLIKNIKNSDGISQFLDKLQQRMASGDSPELKRIKESIKRIFLEPRQIEDDKEVLRQLKDMAELGEKLERYLLNSDNKDPELRDALSNLRDSIDFIRCINQHSNFMQLPIIINGDNSTAKLYVFNKGKRNKAINPEDATAVIVLDLKNLGHLESIIRIKGKTVNVTFRVESKSIGTIIEKNAISLKRPLEEKGYSLAPVKVISLEQPFSLLSLEAMVNEHNIGKIHFDMRI